MKKKLTIAIIAMMALTGSLNLHAQEKGNIIKTNFLSPILRTYVFAYEKVLNDDMGAQLGFYYTGWSVSDTKFSGWAVTPEYRYYLSSKPAPSGIYLAPYLRFQSYSLKADMAGSPEAKATMSVFGGGLLVGAQTLLKETITLEGFLGPSYGSSNLKVDQGTSSDFSTGPFGGFGLRIGVTVGVAF